MEAVGSWASSKKPQFQASAAMLMSSTLFWGITQRRVVPNDAA